ncbi:MAG: MtrB/PioB family outer membrane beta-barrel protein [Thermoguttaceae bacterium]
MKVNYLTLLAAATVVLLSVAATRAEESAATALAAQANAAPAALATTASTASVAPVVPVAAASGDTATYYQDSDPVADFLARAGAWGVHASGSPTKVGEYQNLSSSPFWTGDGIWSNGNQTVDASVQGDDNETSDARLYYFGPHVEANLDYERFQHQLDAHDFAGFNYDGQNNTAGPKPNTANNIVLYTENNLSPGQDFAIRVQEWKANFKGNITENLKWRLNVFGIDKEGERQANVFQHCSASAGNGSTGPNGSSLAGTNLTEQCHVTSQSQHIDWQTTEVTPSLELRMGCDTFLEYSHTIRAFTANDQMVSYNYDTAVAAYSPNPTAVTAAGSNPAKIALLRAGYDIVPDSQTQIDRLKFSTKIGCNTDAYLLGYDGYNEDLLRDTYRNFNGADLRITNKSFETLTLTAYGKYYREDSTSPLSPLSPYPVNGVPANNFYQEPYLGGGEQINREIHTFGINGRWRPFEDECGTYASRLSFVGGYEYSTLMRENAGDTLLSGGPGQFINSSGFFTQPNSNTNTFTVGVEEKWSPKFDTFLRYKFISTDYPLYGITPDAGQLYAELNSALPTQQNRVELGCTWTPTDCLMVNATLYVENAMSDAPYVAWTSNSLPFTLSAWWAPTQQWSFSAGASEMDSWINQNVALSNLNASPGWAVSVPWQYIGVADVFNLGSRYQATEKLSFNGEFEYVHGENSSSAIVTPTNQTPPLQAGLPTTPYNIGQYSLVKMQSFRLGVGADYRLRPCVTAYVRYNYYDYQDESGTTSGQASMVLGGMSAKF